MYIDPFQAEFYRVNGDYNPLHIDHSVATSVGFPAPILHGLCTFGTACRAVLQAYTNGDPKTFKTIKVRFASPVYPGTTLRTEMWDDENNTENAKNGSSCYVRDKDERRWREERCCCFIIQLC